MEHWVKVIVLSLGGAMGVNARYWLGVWISSRTSGQMPWATFMINISGSFLIGLLTVLLGRWLPHPNLRLFLVVGFLGGYTTFSSFSHEILMLVERGEVGPASGYAVGSVIAGLAAVVAGAGLGRILGGFYS